MKQEYLEWIEFCVKKYITDNGKLDVKSTDFVDFKLNYMDGTFKLDINKGEETELYRGNFSIIAMANKVELYFNNIDEEWIIKV